MTDEILKRIDVLAAKLNTTGELLFGTLVRQARIDGIEYVVYTSICIAILVGCALWMRHALRDEDGDQMAGAILIGVLALAFALVFADGAIAGLANPQYGAVQSLGKLLGGK